MAYSFRNIFFVCATTHSCSTCHDKLKCCKAIWLQPREELRSNCKRTQSSESRFFLCEEYELLLRRFACCAATHLEVGLPTPVPSRAHSPEEYHAHRRDGDGRRAATHLEVDSPTPLPSHAHSPEEYHAHRRDSDGRRAATHLEVDSPTPLPSHAHSPEEYHAHTRDGGGRRTAQVMWLEQEVHVGPKLDPLTGGHSQQSVIVQHGVERLDPLGVDVSVANDPRLDIDWLPNYLASRIGQHAVRPLPSVHVDLAE